MTLEEFPVIMQLISFCREVKGKKVDRAILRTLRKVASPSVPELAGWTGYSEKVIQDRVDVLEVKLVVRTINGRVYLASIFPPPRR